MGQYYNRFGFTTPLITTASGGKMGKTADGAVWLNADKALGDAYVKSPYDYWQFWRNTDDADVGRFLRLFTDLSLSEISVLEALEGADINQAKIQLANAVTQLLHGAEAAKTAEDTARKTFEQGGSAKGLPTFKADISDLALIDAALLCGLAASKGEARRHIKGGALKLNDQKVEALEARLSPSDINPDGVIKISVGKKRHALIQPH